MIAVKGWYGAPRTRSQVPCHNLKAGIAAVSWAEHGHWYHGLQALVAD